MGWAGNFEPLYESPSSQLRSRKSLSGAGLPKVPSLLAEESHLDAGDVDVLARPDEAAAADHLLLGLDRRQRQQQKE